MKTNKLWIIKVEANGILPLHVFSYAGSLEHAYTIAWVISRLSMARVRLYQRVMPYEMEVGFGNGKRH